MGFVERFILVCFLVLPAQSNAHSMSQAKKFKILESTIRTDFQANWKEKLKEFSDQDAALAVKTDENPAWWTALLFGEEMTPETKAIIGAPVYNIIESYVAAQGGHVSREYFDRTFSKMLDYVSKAGLMPRAVSLGVMARAQAGVGASVGGQFNFYFEKGQFKLSSYTLLAGHAGYAAMTKIQFYAALCFGDCVGGAATGWYLGLDTTAEAGLGADIFIEGGFEISDWWDGLWNDKKPLNLKDYYQTKAIYVGIGADVGLGAGVSGDLFYFSLIDDWNLSNLAMYLDPKVIEHYLNPK